MPSKSQIFANGARQYYACALAADDKIGVLPGFEISAPYPVMTLVAHSIELSLKSFLLANGVSDVKQYGHNLLNAYNKCLEIGLGDEFKLTSSDSNVLAIISDLHSNMTLRYNENSELGRLPVFGPLQALAEKFLLLCGAPPLSELLGMT